MGALGQLGEEQIHGSLVARANRILGIPAIVDGGRVLDPRVNYQAVLVQEKVPVTRQAKGSDAIAVFAVACLAMVNVVAAVLPNL